MIQLYTHCVTSLFGPHRQSHAVARLNRLIDMPKEQYEKLADLYKIVAFHKFYSEAEERLIAGVVNDLDRLTRFNELGAQWNEWLKKSHPCCTSWDNPDEWHKEFYPGLPVEAPKPR